MLDEFELHLGYEVAISIAYQGTNPRIGSLFVGPYTTRLVRGIRILEGTNRMSVVEGVASMSLETFKSMGMLQCVHNVSGVEYQVQ